MHESKHICVFRQRNAETNPVQLEHRAESYHVDQITARAVRELDGVHKTLLWRTKSEERDEMISIVLDKKKREACSSCFFFNES